MRSKIASSPVAIATPHANRSAPDFHLFDTRPSATRRVPLTPLTRRTKIVATIGPASRDPETLVRMVEAGMDVARLNFSHGDHETHAETAERVREAAGRAGRPVALLQDLPGPKLRVGQLEGEKVEL